MSRPPRMTIARCSLLLPLAMAGVLLVSLSAHDATAQLRAVKRANSNRPQQNQPGKPADPSARGAVYMLDADRFDGPIKELKDGWLSIDSDPPKMVALDEVDRIELGSGAEVVMVWVGQDNHDGVQAGSTQGGNGVQDIHLECRGIPLNRTLQQMVVSGVFGGQAYVWMFNLNNTPFWKLENSRPANSTTTNFYIEPPAVDCFDQFFDVMLTFNDNGTFKTKLKATTHTDAKLKVEAQAATPAGKPDAGEIIVILEGEETVRGRSIEIGSEMLIVQPVTGGELQVPMADVLGIWMGGNNAPAQRKRFDERLKKPGEADWVLVRGKNANSAGKDGAGKEGGDKEGADKESSEKEKPAAENEGAENPNPQAAAQVADAQQQLAQADAARQAAEKEKADKEKAEHDKQAGQNLGERAGTDKGDKEPVAVDGSVQSIALGKLSILVGSETRKVALPRVLGIVMAAHPAGARPETFYQIFELASGDKMAGQLTAVKTDMLDVHTRYGGDVQLPRGEIRSITCRGGQATYLSDLEPASVEEVAYFDRSLNYHRDQNLSGGPLAVRGTTFRKGLAVHSRCVLTYALDGRYELFRSRLGFEDGAPLGGSIACRVLADDRELYNNATLRADAESVSLKLDLTGAKQLILEVDFGETQNIGDRVVWGAARVVKPAGSTAQPATAQPAASTPASPAAPAASDTASAAPAATAPGAEAGDAEAKADAGEGGEMVEVELTIEAGETIYFVEEEEDED